MINIEMNKTSGVTLATAGKYCEENIKVTPLLQQKQASENGEVTADNGYAGLSKVTVNVASGASLNIAYGDTAPEDTTKLWVNGAEPSKVIATNQMNGSMTTTAQLTNELTAYYYCNAVVVGSVLYIAPHTEVSNGTAIAIKRFNIVSKEFLSNLLTMPIATVSSGYKDVISHIFTKNNKIFVIVTTHTGMVNSTSKVTSQTLLAYNITDNTWETLSSFTYNYLNSAGILVGDYYYVFGGVNRTADYGTISTTARMYRYDINNDEWVSMAYGKNNVQLCAIATFDDKYIYIFGGRIENSSSTTVNTIQKYDILSGTWTLLTATLPEPNSRFSAVTFGDKIYLLGGAETTAGTITKKIYAFDKNTETVSLTDYSLAVEISAYGCAQKGNEVYLVSGYTTGTVNWNGIQTLTLEQPLPQNQLLLNTTLAKNLFKIINGDTAEIEIGVNGVYRGNANGIAELESANVFDTSQYAWVDVQSGAVVDKLASVVNITSSASEYAYNVYDGTDTSGTLRATLGGANGTLTATIPCYSGYLYFENTNADTTWEDVTVTDNLGVTTSVGGLLFNVNGDGAITATVVVKASGYTVTINNTYSVELVGYVNGTITYADGTTATLTQAGNGQATVSYQDVTYIKLTDIYANSNGIVSVTGTTQSALMSGVTLENDVTIDIYAYPCYIEGTQITLADGSTKAVEDITYEDDLLVWNFYKGTYDTAKPTWIKVKQVASQYNKVTFDNGAEVGFVGPANLGYHRIFNKEAGKFTYTGAPETPNGTTTLSCNTRGGWTKVVSQEIVKEKINFYNIITDKHYNLFANGILTSCRLSNKYAIEDMKYVGDLLITADEEKAYFERIEHLKVKKQ